VVIAAAHATDCPDSAAALIHPNPHAAFAQIAAALHPQAPLQPGIHPSALVHEGARIAASAEIGPFVVVGDGAVVGERCRIAAHGIIGDNVELGSDSRLAEHVTVLGGCRIGARCIVHPGAVIGADGFGNARADARWIKVPQLGAVRIGDDVEVGANTTIDRGALDDTVIEDGVRLDNLIQVAHNVTIGAHTAIAACVGIAGSTRIGRRCMIGGGAGIGGQLTIGDDIVIGGFGQVTRSIAGPGMYTNVLPAEEAGVWRRILGRIKRLEQLVARVGRLEAAARTVPKTGQETEHDEQ
jgi:UDP-3-O-[3-hydroxymyristoyl] glucosamine N-acyltransferase